MGSFVKRLGQWSRKSLESESAHIFQKVKANKVPGSLSMILDGTLKEGHDMKIFGMGTLATMASRTQYQRFLINLHAVYSTLEEELDATSIPAIQSSVVRSVWKNHESTLRRQERLLRDVQEINDLITMQEGTDNTTNSSSSVKMPRVSRHTLSYLQAIRIAGEVDRETGSGRLLGHLYCRYFADLFGGQMLARPYQCALQLPPPQQSSSSSSSSSSSPRHLQFDFGVIHRQALIEQLYSDLNKAGELLTDAQREDVRKESLLAFHHNVQVYSEEPNMFYNAGRGFFNIVVGWAASFSNSK
jgi:heme oxygenase